MCQFAGTPAGSRARGKRRLPERGTKKMGYLKYLKLMNRMNAVTQVPQPPVPQFEQFCKLFGVAEMLKNLTAFIGNCNFHNGISFASFA